MNADEARKAQVVAAAMALREDRLAGGMSLLTASGYGLMFSALSAIDVGKVECQVIDLRPGRMNNAEVGRGSGAHVGGALLKALGPLLEAAGKRPKLQGITGGRAIDKHRTPKTEVLDDANEVTVTAVDREAGVVTVEGTRELRERDALVFDGNGGMVEPEGLRVGKARSEEAVANLDERCGICGAPIDPTCHCVSRGLR